MYVMLREVDDERQFAVEPRLQLIRVGLERGSHLELLDQQAST